MADVVVPGHGAAFRIIRDGRGDAEGTERRWGGRRGGRRGQLWALHKNGGVLGEEVKKWDLKNGGAYDKTSGKGETIGVNRKTIGVKGGSGRDHWGHGGAMGETMG